MFKEASTYNNHHRPAGVHWNCDCLHQKVHGWCDSHQDHHHTCKPKAVDDSRGSWAAKTRDEAFRSGDKVALKTARTSLSCGIKMQNGHMLKKINNHFTDSRGHTEPVASHSGPSLTTSPRHRPCYDDPSLPDTLNHFYSRLKCRMTHLHKNCPHLPTTRRSVCLQPT